MRGIKLKAKGRVHERHPLVEIRHLPVPVVSHMLYKVLLPVHTCAITITIARA